MKQANPDVNFLPVCRDNLCEYIHPCGPRFCSDDEYCCNLSCGTCVSKEEDIGCSDVICIFDRDQSLLEDDDDDIDAQEVLSGLGCQDLNDCLVFAGCQPGDPCPMVSCLNSQCVFNQPCGETFCTQGEFCCSTSDCGKCVSYRDADTCRPETTCDEDRTDDDVVTRVSDGFCQRETMRRTHF